MAQSFFLTLSTHAWFWQVVPHSQSPCSNPRIRLQGPQWTFEFGIRAITPSWATHTPNWALGSYVATGTGSRFHSEYWGDPISNSTGERKEIKDTVENGLRKLLYCLLHFGNAFEELIPLFNVKRSAFSRFFFPAILIFIVFPDVHISLAFKSADSDLLLSTKLSICLINWQKKVFCGTHLPQGFFGVCFGFCLLDLLFFFLCFFSLLLCLFTGHRGFLSLPLQPQSSVRTVLACTPNPKLPSWRTWSFQKK